MLTVTVDLPLSVKVLETSLIIALKKYLVRNEILFTIVITQIEVELAEAICAITSACLHGKIEQSTMHHICSGVTKATSTIQVQCRTVLNSSY